MTFHWHDAHVSAREMPDRVADWISDNVGSWWSVWVHTAWFVLWFVLRLNVDILTLIVSLEAIYLCVFLLMSGGRQSERDRLHAEADYQVNIASEARIESLQIQIARLEVEKMDHIIGLLEQRVKVP